MTRRNQLRRHENVDDDFHKVHHIPHDIHKHTKKGKIDSPAMHKLRDKLDMSISSPQKGSPAQGMSNIQPVRLTSGSGGIDRFSPVVDKSQSRPQGTQEDFQNVPHAHGHVSGSPYARRRPMDIGK